MRCCTDVLEQAEVDARHRTRRGGAAPVEQWHEPESGRVPVLGSIRLEPDQLPEIAGQHALAVLAAKGQRAPEPSNVFGREIYPSVPEILADIPHDVGQLQRDPERVSERFRGRGIAAAEDSERE